MLSVVADSQVLYAHKKVTRRRALAPFTNYTELTMKTPQRNFVVEFKSSRRLSKTPTSSIWGDTDLKALAREVEDQHSDLPGQTHGVSSAADTLPDPVEMGPSNQAAVDVDTVQISKVSAEDLNADGLLGVDALHPGHGSAPAAPENLPAPKRRSISNRALKGRVRRSSAPESMIQAAPLELADASLLLDEVATLDAENKRLKQLLVEQLRDQNLTLKQMLGRFGLS